MNTLRTLTDSEIDFVSGAGGHSLLAINVAPVISIPVLSFNGIGNTNNVAGIAGIQTGNIIGSFDLLGLPEEIKEL